MYVHTWQHHCLYYNAVLIYSDCVCLSKLLLLQSMQLCSRNATTYQFSILFRPADRATYAFTCKLHLYATCSTLFIQFYICRWIPCCRYLCSVLTCVPLCCLLISCAIFNTTTNSYCCKQCCSSVFCFFSM